jgi:hypothetical protein
MIVDPSELNGVLELNADLCILGAGPSGLTLARELEDGAIGGTAHFPPQVLPHLARKPLPSGMGMNRVLNFLYMIAKTTYFRYNEPVSKGTALWKLDLAGCRGKVLPGVKGRRNGKRWPCDNQAGQRSFLSETSGDVFARYVGRGTPERGDFGL